LAAGLAASWPAMVVNCGNDCAVPASWRRMNQEEYEEIPEDAGGNTYQVLLSSVGCLTSIQPVVWDFIHPW